MLSKEIVNRCPSIFQNAFSDPIFIEKTLLIIYTIIFIIGLVGNIMTIIIIKCNTHLRTPTNIYLLNLAVSDLMMLICNLPLEMIEIHFREWPLSIMFCTLRNICVEFFTCSSILTILAFSCERYFAIVHPIHFHQLNHFHRSQNVIIIIWFLSLLVSVPIGFSYEIETNLILISPHATRYIPKTLNDSKIQRTNETLTAIHIYCKSCVPKKQLIKLLSVVMIIISLFFFYFPMIIIGIIYLFIIKALRHVNKCEKDSNLPQLDLSPLTSRDVIPKQRMSSLSYNSSIINKEKSMEMKTKGSHFGSYSWLKNRSRYQARKVVVKTLVAVVIAFFICYAPLYLQRVLSAIMSINLNFYSHSYVFSNIMAHLYIISGITFYFGSIINPILYNVVSNKYRRAFRDLFCCRITYQATPNVKTQQKSFQINYHQIHRFTNTMPMQRQRLQQQQQEQQSQRTNNNNNNKRNSNIEMNQYNLEVHKQIRLIPLKKRPVSFDIQSARSNSTSTASHHRELYQVQFLRSNVSLPKKMSNTQSCETSLAEKIIWPKTVV